MFRGIRICLIKVAIIPHVDLRKFGELGLYFQNKWSVLGLSFEKKILYLVCNKHLLLNRLKLSKVKFVSIHLGVIVTAQQQTNQNSNWVETK